MQMALLLYVPYGYPNQGSAANFDMQQAAS
jgi:hypothetical protein